jgi:Mg2+/Co2+ transporter CorC
VAGTFKLALMGEPKDRDELMDMLRDAQQRELLDPTP